MQKTYKRKQTPVQGMKHLKVTGDGKAWLVK